MSSESKKAQWQFDARSFLLGVGMCLSLAVPTAIAVDLKSLQGVGAAVASLGTIKTDLDKNVKALKLDATALLGDKDNLLKIKDQLTVLATQTRTQIDSITKLVGVVEGHLKQTQTNIQSTATNVGRIDGVKNKLTSGK